MSRARRENESFEQYRANLKIENHLDEVRLGGLYLEKHEFLSRKQKRDKEFMRQYKENIKKHADKLIAKYKEIDFKKPTE